MLEINNITALLPMKGHSERVPNKNMRDCNGRPLFHHIAATLENSAVISRILIDTDSAEIAENARQNFSKVEIIERPSSLHGDYVSMNDIIAYDISTCAEEHFLQTHSTNPLLQKNTIEDAVNEYFKYLEEYDSLYSVTRIQNRFYWQSGEPVNHNPGELIRTQDLPPLFEENSNIYIFSKQSFSEAGKQRIGKRPRMYEVNKIEAVDIDDEEDFLIAEALLKERQ